MAKLKLILTAWAPSPLLHFIDTKKCDLKSCSIYKDNWKRLARGMRGMAQKEEKHYRMWR
uniref:Uncharacterized protein n=1 Tax=Arion vulgaris TaxID=1028688 RepID=A0A0B7ANZ7_9EUPU